MTTLPPSRCNRMRGTQGALFYYHLHGIATLERCGFYSAHTLCGDGQQCGTNAGDVFRSGAATTTDKPCPGAKPGRGIQCSNTLPDPAVILGHPGFTAVRVNQQRAPRLVN